MKKSRINSFKTHFTLLCLVIILFGCRTMSEKETDKSAGVNGGFEISKNKLPVNWLMYTPNTVPDSDFTIELDNSSFKEGKQSLKFDVKICSNIGGWNSPGFTNQFSETGGFKGEHTYKVSFWIKNKGAKYRLNAGGVSPFKGEMKVLLEENEDLDEWKMYEYKVKVPQDMELRFQLNILEPGTFWIDDKWFYKIHDQHENREVVCSPIDSVRGNLYFENSKYFIFDGALHYMGNVMVADSTVSCVEDQVIIDKSKDVFKVLDMSNYNHSGNQAFAVFNDKYLFHGCYLDTIKLNTHLKESLEECYANGDFATEISIK